MDCIKDIVGLLKYDECCLIGLDYVVSKSGLYLDDTTAGRIPLSVGFFSNYESYNRIIPEAINEAINVTRQKLDLNLTKQYRQNRSIIGYKDDYTNFGESSTDYFYLSIKPKRINGGLMRINAITIYTITGKHTGNVLVISNGVELYNGLIANFTPLNVTFDENIYVAYKGDRPRQFKHTGCCGKTGTYRGWVEIGSDIKELTSQFEHIANDYSNGIELDITFDCNAFSDIFCDIDFKNSGFGYGFASLVQMIARKNLAYYILTNDKVTSYLLVSKEEINGIIGYLVSEIEKTLNYLPQAYSESDCYVCNGLYKGQILV